MAPLLDVRNLSVRYGGVAAVTNASLSVEDRDIVTIIGANGAGKSSLLNAIAGIVRPSRGEVIFKGNSIAGWPSHRVAVQGIAMVPEGRHLFPDMTVMENLQLGAYARSDRDGVAYSIERVFGLFPRLRERNKQLAGSMSGGEQQMLAIGRALMSHVRLLLLDEPSLGLAPVIIREIIRVIKEINEKEGLAIVLVEQNARMALSLAKHAYVLETSKVVASGPAAEVAASEVVRKAYLGL